MMPARRVCDAAIRRTAEGQGAEYIAGGTDMLQLLQEGVVQAFTARRFERCRLVVETSAQLSAWEVQPPEDLELHHQLTGRALAALSQPL